MKSKYFIFDLDDTLVYEIDYLKSAFKEIAYAISSDGLEIQMLTWYHNGIDVFQKLAENYSVNKQDLLEKYRTHFPSITLNEGAISILNQIKEKGHFLGLITDGRSVTQRNKLRALEIENIFNKIIISEEIGSTKPNKKNFEAFHRDDVSSYFYIGDNTNKDFLTPNLLGWKSVCLMDKGSNIHKQNFDFDSAYLPQYKITSLYEISKFI